MGVGVGIAETICLMKQDKYITNGTAKLFMRTWRTNLAGNQSFRSWKFEEGIQLANRTHGCSL